MNYLDWNSRTFGFFAEECLNVDDSDEDCSDLSISGFRNPSRYSKDERSKLYQYLSNAKGIFATTCWRKNAYDQSREASYSLLTDGEVVFDNLVLKYILYPDFVLPERWFVLIKEKNFVMPKFEFDDSIFLYFEVADHETFDQESYIKKFIRHL
jgi:hypothetical protein